MDSVGGSHPTGSNDDTLLGRFMLWGGLFVGTADGALNPQVKSLLEALTVPGVDLEELIASDADLAALALEKFKAAKASRRAKLRANELTNLMRQLVAFAALDNTFSDNEKSRLAMLARELGLHENAVDLLIQQYQKETQA